MKITRLSNIVSGYPAALLIDGKVTYLKGKKNTVGAYVVIRRHKYYESQLPIGEEVVVNG